MTAEAGNARQELREILQALWRRKWVVLALAAVVMIVAVALTWRQSKVYEARAYVLISRGEGEQVIADTNEGRLEFERTVANELEFTKSDELRNAVFDALGPTPRVVAAAGDGDVLTFTVRGAMPGRLAEIANTTADIYVRLRSERVVRDYLETISVVQQQMQDLDDQEVAIQAPIDDFAATLDPTALDTLGFPIASPEEITAYERRLSTMERTAQAELALLAVSRESLQRTLDELQLSSNLQQGGTAQITRRASVPVHPIEPSWGTNMVIGAIAALLAGIGAAMALEYTDDRVRRVSDLRSLLPPDTPIVSIPTIEKDVRFKRRDPQEMLVMSRDRHSEAAESFRELRGLVHQLRASMAEDRNVNLHDELMNVSLVVTSAEPAAGKTFTSCNLAFALAQGEQETILADLDLRRPTVHEYLSLENRRGMSDYLEGKDVLASHVVQGLDAFTAGRSRPNPSELVLRLKRLERDDQFWLDYDFAVFDIAPVLAVSDAAAVAPAMDVVILVARQGQTHASDFVETLERVRGATDAPLIVVLNDIERREHYYQYQYRYRDPQPAGTEA